MRLICPNCDAQYEVPDDVMPLAGRDVQCSNCGHTWFEHHPNHAPDAYGDPDGGEDDDGLEDNHEDEIVMSSDKETERPAITQAQRKSLDPAVTDILREEAKRETQARQSDSAGGVESQPDLGLDKGPDASVEAAKRADQARERMARMRGSDTEYEDAAEAAATAAALGSRRDMLPDIEEINSTLRSSSDRVTAMADDGEFGAPAVTKQRNFRSGFLMVLLIAVLVLLVYIYAPAIAQKFPQLEPVLTGFVGLIDQARAWLDGHVVALLQWLDVKANTG
ncbi:MAG: zinc-ribbon domain-containing protein [Sulfitobacter sp.]